MHPRRQMYGFFENDEEFKSLEVLKDKRRSSTHILQSERERQETPEGSDGIKLPSIKTAGVRPRNSPLGTAAQQQMNVIKAYIEALLSYDNNFINKLHEFCNENLELRLKSFKEVPDELDNLVRKERAGDRNVPWRGFLGRNGTGDQQGPSSKPRSGTAEFRGADAGDETFCQSEEARGGDDKEKWRKRAKTLRLKLAAVEKKNLASKKYTDELKKSLSKASSDLAKMKEVNQRWANRMKREQAADVSLQRELDACRGRNVTLKRMCEERDVLAQNLAGKGGADEAEAVLNLQEYIRYNESLIKELKAENKLLKQEMQKKEQIIEEIKVVYDHQKERLKKLEDRLAESEKRILNKDGELFEHKNMVQECTIKVELYQDENVSLTEEIQSKEEQLRKVRSECNHLEKELKTKQDMFVAAVRKYEEVTDVLCEERRLTESLQNEIKMCELKKASLEKTLQKRATTTPFYKS